MSSSTAGPWLYHKQTPHFLQQKPGVQRTRKVSSMRLRVPNRVNCAVRNGHQFKNQSKLPWFDSWQDACQSDLECLSKHPFPQSSVKGDPEKCMHFAGGFCTASLSLACLPPRGWAFLVSKSVGNMVQTNCQ